MPIFFWPSGPAPGATYTPGASIWSDLLRYTQAAIRSLNLSYTPTGQLSPVTLPSGQVYRKAVPSDMGVGTPPCIQVCHAGWKEDPLELPGTYEDTVVVYPVLVFILFAGNQNRDVNEDLLAWRQALIDAFIDLRAVTVTSANVFDCWVYPNVSLDLESFHGKNWDTSGILLHFKAEYGRPQHN